MTRVGLAIDPVTNDLFLRADGSLAVVTDAEAVGQHARQRLMTFRGEWFLDTDAGVPWLDQIFAQRYDPALAEAVVKETLLGTDGVIGISSTFAISFDNVPRRLNVRSIDVTTDYDQVVNV